MAVPDQSSYSSESDFEFIQTPKAATPTFEKFEECGVQTTNVCTRVPSCPQQRQLLQGLCQLALI
jgi:hypothetical protein